MKCRKENQDHKMKNTDEYEQKHRKYQFQQNAKRMKTIHIEPEKIFDCTLATRTPKQIAFSGVYAGDLLSDVMGHAREGNIWVTMQTHKNVAAIAGLKDIRAVIIVGNNQPDADMLSQCECENISVFTTGLHTYEVCGMLYEYEKKSHEA
ncbi:MAG TPA: hypothetical protein PLM49_07730 [Bacteroidales bacterium]|nr:hypothetical protein [Bacteroidales bacterium]